MPGETIEISVDGGRMPAFLSKPSPGERQPAIIVIHEIFGLTPHIEDVANRIAETGYMTLAPDLFWNVGPLPDFSDRESFIRFRQSLDDEQILTSIDAAIAELREQPEVEVARIGIVGFCLGGFYSFLAAARNPTLAACADFYGAPVQKLLGPAHEMRVPVLCLFGKEDQSIPPEAIGELRAVLQETGTPFEFHIYPDAGHAFFNDTGERYRPEAAADAWNRLQAFYGQYLKPARV